MNIASATFECSAPNLDACPEETLPEFAFIGRSNVGKSSLLNFLAGREGLARVSPTPGFTKLINFFVINQRWRLVDLPGYGFAQVAHKDRSRFNRAVAGYLEARPNLACVFALVDGSLPPQDIDIEFLEWLVTKRLPFVIVLTKTDKLPPAQLAENQAALSARIGDWFIEPPAMLTCSSKDGSGRWELLQIIQETLDSLAPTTPAEDETSAIEETHPHPAPRGPSKPSIKKKRPDLKRPW